MSYFCEKCGSLRPEKESPEKEVFERRAKRYPFRAKAQAGKNGERKDDPGGEGWEIVREGNVCPPCVGK